jgi:hypothetical protein
MSSAKRAAASPALLDPKVLLHRSDALIFGKFLLRVRHHAGWIVNGVVTVAPGESLYGMVRRFRNETEGVAVFTAAGKCDNISLVLHGISSP